MIGHLRGKVIHLGDDTAVIDVGGVGYEVAATPRLLSSLAMDQEVSLFIETLVAETFIKLIAFQSDQERRAFRLLQSVQGVGSKAALAILHVLPPSALVEAVTYADKTAVARAQGVGPKLALRVVTELKGKLGAVLTGQGAGPQIEAAPSAPAPAAPSARGDAVLALINLGYDEAAARRALTSIEEMPDETVERLIPWALKILAAA